MRVATIERTWGECRRNGRKVEDYSWEVTFYEGEMIDRHYYKEENVANERASMYEAGNYTKSQYGGVCFPSDEQEEILCEY